MTDQLREAVVRGVSALADLTPGRTGNLSARDGERIAITPSGVPYADVRSGDLPVLDVDGSRIDGSLDPSSETPMHLGIYRALDVGAVVHAHAPWSTTLAVLRDPLPPVHYVLALAGGEVPVAPYAPYGTAQLAAHAVAAMEEAGTTACLLANHGLVAAGADVGDALEVAAAVESTARVYLQARSVGDPVALSADELDAASARFESYGQDGGDQT